MEIRKAKKQDIPGIGKLLYQVLEVHHKARPDLFYSGVKKYNDEEVLAILEDDTRPVFVAVEEEQVLGYVFCIFQQVKDSHILTPVKTLYIDDLCVDEKFRGKNIGKKLYEFACLFAKSNGCYNLTMNVWGGNEAVKFYGKMGMGIQKIGMETIL
jgi:ribosomal protein S18 acetylase RimI-like enzyme